MKVRCSLQMSGEREGWGTSSGRLINTDVLARYFLLSIHCLVWLCVNLFLSRCVFQRPLLTSPALKAAKIC